MKTEFFCGEIQEPQFPEKTFSAQNYESIQRAVTCTDVRGLVLDQVRLRGE